MPPDFRDRGVVVVGAGAAGLWAAAVAARRGADVLLLEKTPRAGTKVLASGGTRCNLTTTLPAREAGRLFRSAGARFLAPALAALSPADLRRRFAGLGVPTVAAPLEKVFPASGRARDVRDALQREVGLAGAELLLSAPVVGLEPTGRRAWRVHLADGRSVGGERVVLAAGGASYPRTGTTGDGYGWLAELDLPLVEPTPALVPLTSPAPWVRDLTGVSLPDVAVRLVDGGRVVLGRRRRPLLFTHRGVSGPAAMDLSVHVGRAPSAGDGGGMHLVLDLVPELEREVLRARLVEAAAAPGRPRLGRVLPGVPRRVLAAAARQAGAGAGDGGRPAGLSRAGRHALVEALKGLVVPVDGTEGFERAEVTAGGLALGAVDPRTMGVNARPGLFVVGELLDLDGPIGGLSFQAAFATAELAGRAVSPSLGRNTGGDTGINPG